MFLLFFYSYFLFYSSYFFFFFFFFFHYTATTQIYTLSLHDALPIAFDIGLPAQFALGAHLARDARHFRRKGDRKSTRLNSSHPSISYAGVCLKKKDERGVQGDGDHRERAFSKKSRHGTPRLHFSARLLPVVWLPSASVQALAFFFYGRGDRRDLHSFPTRRSSD